MSDPQTDLVKPPCPFCKSEKVATTTKAVNDATYWRCLTCGQVWNPARLVTRPPPRRW